MNPAESDAGDTFCWECNGNRMANRNEFTFSNSFRVDRGVRKAFEDEGFILLRSLWNGAEVEKLLRFFETSPAIERNSYREIDGRGMTADPSPSILIYLHIFQKMTENSRQRISSKPNGNSCPT